MEKMAYTKRAVSYAVNHLAGSDYSSLTVYDDEADVLVAGRPVAGVARRLCPGASPGVAKLNASLLRLRHERYDAMTRKRLAYESYQRRRFHDLRGN